MSDLTIEVCGPCWGKEFNDFEESCDCTMYDGGDPEKFGYPPYHKGCMCVVTGPSMEHLMDMSIAADLLPAYGVKISFWGGIFGKRYRGFIVSSDPDKPGMYVFTGIGWKGRLYCIHEEFTRRVDSDD